MDDGWDTNHRLCCAWLQKLDFLFTCWNFDLNCVMKENTKNSIWHLACDFVIKSPLINLSTPRIRYLIHIIFGKQHHNLKFQTHGGVLGTRIVWLHANDSVSSFVSLKWAQWSVKNANFCSHGSLLCPISLRDWHAYISKYGPSRTWFQLKSDVTLWAQEEMSLLYLSDSSLDLHFKHVQSNIGTVRFM